MIKLEDWEWLGHAGHHCCAERCLFHLTTKVGDYLISTVGDFYPEMNRKYGILGKKDTVGYNRYFETYVFKCGEKLECGCYALADGCEIEGVGCNDGKTASQNHQKMCYKYASL